MTLPIALVTIFCVVGIVASLIAKRSDSPVEELSEQVIEQELEMILDLPDNSLDGKIDISYKTPEK